MNVKYEYKGKIFNLSLKDINKIKGYFKLSLRKRLGISINEYLKYKGFQIDSCRICEIGDVPLDIDINISNGFIEVSNFRYIKKIYCYGNNKDCDGIRMNPNSFEFISKVNNISIDESKILLKINNKSPFYKENWVNEIEYKKSQSRSIDYYINKYGYELVNEKFNEHIIKISKSNSRDRYINEYGKELGEKIFEIISSKKDSMSFNFFLKKNDNNAKLAILEYEERKKSVNNSVKNLIEKYGYNEAIEKHKNRVKKYKETFDINPNKTEIFKSRAITIDNLHKKYGDINIATKKYYEWREKISVPICKASKESLKIFLPIIEILKNDYSIEDSDIFIGNNNKSEYFIREDKTIYFYDFTIKSKKLIIEYNGILFHPKDENSEWENPFNKKTAYEAYKKQREKIKIAENIGFSVLEIWSDDFDNKQKCLDFIKNNINNI